MVTYLSERKKALVAAAGVVVNLLYVYNTAKANVWVSAVLAGLAVLGVHQTSNE